MVARALCPAAFERWRDTSCSWSGRRQSRSCPSLPADAPEDQQGTTGQRIVALAELVPDFAALSLLPPPMELTTLRRRWDALVGKKLAAPALSS